MNCWNCGAELKPGSRFCTACGADQQAQRPQQPPQPQQGWQQPQQGWQQPQQGWQQPQQGWQQPQQGWQQPQQGWQQPQQGWQQPQQGWQQPQQGWQQPQQDWQQPPAGGPVPGGDNEMILKVFAAVCAVVYGIAAVRGLIGVVQSLLRFFFSVPGLLGLVSSVAAVAVDLLMCLLLVMLITKRTPQNSDGLLVLLAVDGVAIAAVRLLWMILWGITNRYLFLDYLGKFFQALLGAAVVVVGVYAILRFVMNEFPLVSKSKDELIQEAQEALASLGQTASEAAHGAKASWDANQQARQAQQQAQWQNQQQSQWQGQQPQWQGQQPQWQGQPTTPPPGYAVSRLKADRSLLAYILLTIITCGIYSWYFFYALARDVNIACAGDGKQTAGLIKFIVLTILTCGIYAWIWYYSLGNRLAANAPRYGMNFQENGTTVLLWFLFGSLLCGIGPFIGMNIIIKNSNAICGAYNYMHGI